MSRRLLLAFALSAIVHAAIVALVWSGRGSEPRRIPSRAVSTGVPIDFETIAGWEGSGDGVERSTRSAIADRQRDASPGPAASPVARPISDARGDTIRSSGTGASLPVTEPEVAPSSPPAPADDAPVPTQDGEHAGVTAKNEGIALDGASLGESNSLSVSGGTASDGRGAGGPAGSGHGASIGGGPGAGAAGGGRGAIGQMDYGALEAHLRSRAARCYPRAAERRSIEGVVSLAFCIDEAGGPAAIRLVRRSGSELLDQAAIECVLKGAAPLPAPAGCISSLPIRFSLP